MLDGVSMMIAVRAAAHPSNHPKTLNTRTETFTQRRAGGACRSYCRIMLAKNTLPPVSLFSDRNARTGTEMGGL